MKQTDVLSCLMSAQEKEKHNLCMRTHEEYKKIEVTVDSGASDEVASVEKLESYPIEKTTASGTTYSSAVGKQAEEIVNVGQRYIRRRSLHGELGQVPDVQRSRSRQDPGKRQQIGGLWTLGGVQTSRLGEGTV